MRAMNGLVAAAATAALVSACVSEDAGRRDRDSAEPLRTSLEAAASSSSTSAVAMSDDAAERSEAVPRRKITLSSCATSDNGFPDLEGITVSPALLDVTDGAEWLTVVARPVDRGGPGPATGITEVTVSLNRPYLFKMRPQPDGTWAGRVRVPMGVAPGRLWVGGVRLRDAGERMYGHVRDFSFSRAEAARRGAVAEVVSVPDREQPELRWLRMSATSVDVTERSAEVQIRARVTDNGTGVSSVSVQKDVGGESRLRLLTGTPNDGTWGGTLTASRWTKRRSTTWNLLLSVTDRPGNELFLYSSDLADRHLPSTLTIRTDNPDRTKPTLVHTAMRPSEVDLTGGDRRVTMTIRAEDESGIGFTHFWNRPMHLSSGSRTDGVWRRSVVLDHCWLRTRTLRLTAGLADRALNGRGVRKSVSIVNHADIKPPYPSLDGPRRRPGTVPVTYRFKEDVIGISRVSAKIRPTAPGWGFGVGDPPPAVPGRWTCAASSGQAVDCARGPLRTATWRPDEPLRPGQSYGADFNPEGVLTVMDLAGNPVDPGFRHEDEFAPTWTVSG